jgi:hypothetical protein
VAPWLRHRRFISADVKVTELIDQLFPTGT